MTTFTDGTHYDCAGAGHQSEPRVDNSQPVSIVQVDNKDDLGSCKNLQARLRAIQEADQHTLILDLSALESIDASGLRFLAEVNARAHSRGGRVVCICPDPGIRLVMHETNLDRFLEIAVNMEMAQEALA